MTTNEKWIFVLNSDSLGELRLQDTPNGWNEQKVSFSRSIKYLGLFRAFTTSLRFFGDGKDYVQKVFERNGTEHEINVAIYEYFAKPENRFELFFRGVIDLSTYANEEDKFVEVDINESSFVRKIISRDDIRIDLSSTESIDGETISANDLVTVNIHQREILDVGNYELNEQAATVLSEVVNINGTDWDGLTLPITLITEDSQITNIASQDTKTLGDLDGTFWRPAPQESEVSISGSVAGRIRDIRIGGTTKPLTISFRLRVYVDNTASVIDFDTTLEVIEIEGGLPNGTWTDFEFDFATELGQQTRITVDNVISIIAVDVNTESLESIFQIEFSTTDMTVGQNLQWKDISQAQGSLMFEVGQQLTRVITGKDAFVSDFLGRPDIGHEEFGEGSLISMHSAKQIRKIPDSKASISLTDWFQSQSAMQNLGLGIEYDEVAQPFIRVEKVDHFFNGNVIGSLHSVTKMTKTVAREWIFSDLKVGYNKAETEVTNGLDEYNNKFTWATFIKSIKNEGDFVSKIRTDGYGIEKLRRLSFETNPTEDSKEDNDNFAIVVKEDGNDYKSVKDEDYDTVENIFSPESAYNLDLSPGRNLRRNGNKIRAGLEKYLTEEIKFQFAEQKQSMITKRSDEDITIKENDNILASDLDAPLWLPELYECEFILSTDLYRAIVRNPGGIMKLSTGTLENTTNYNYGWIIDVGYNADTQKSTGQFLRVNLNNPNLVLVDPEGNTPDPILPVQPESGEDFGFEGGFPFVFIGPEEVAEVVMEFDGTRYGLLGYHAEFEVQNFEYEWEGRPDTAAGRKFGVNFSESATTDGGHSLYDDITFKYYFDAGGFNSPLTKSHSKSPIVTGVNHTIRIRKFGTTFEFTIDGVTDSLTLTETIDFVSTDAETVVGSRWANGGPANLYEGNMKYCRFYELDGSGNRVNDLINIDAANDNGATVPNTAADAPASSDLTWFNV